MIDMDYDGSMEIFQKQLDAAGVDYDITNLAGCTAREIIGTVNALIANASMKAKAKEKKVAV